MIVFRGGLEPRPDIVTGHSDLTSQALGGGERLGHGSRQVAGEDIAQEMVVDDNRGHLRGGQVRVVEAAYEREMVLP